jgi:hypothetical protein
MILFDYNMLHCMHRSVVSHEKCEEGRGTRSKMVSNKIPYDGKTENWHTRLICE